MDISAVHAIEYHKMIKCRLSKYRNAGAGIETVLCNLRMREIPIDVNTSRHAKNRSPATTCTVIPNSLVMTCGYAKVQVNLLNLTCRAQTGEITKKQDTGDIH